jgi:tetratricopeptide (TPR) repeat protein
MYQNNDFAISFSFILGNDIELLIKDKEHSYSFIWVSLVNNWIELKEQLESLITGKDMKFYIYGAGLSDEVFFITEKINKELIKFSICAQMIDDTDSNVSFIHVGHTICAFEIDKKRFIDAFYKVLISLSANKKYKIIGEKITKKDLLSETIERYLDEENIYENYSKHLIDCLSYTAINSLDYYDLGFSKYNLKRYKDAVKYLSKSIKMRDDFAWAYRERARAYKALKQYKKAIADFKKAIAIDRNYYEPHNDLGMCYDHLKKYDLALKYYSDALRIEPNSNTSLYNKALTLINKKNFNLAFEYFAKAVKVRSKDIEAIMWQGHCKRKLEKYKQSLDYYKKVLRIDPNHLETLNFSAISYSKIQNFKMALKNIEKALKISPKHKGLLSTLSDIKKAIKNK